MAHRPNAVTRLTLGQIDTELGQELLLYPILQDLDFKASINSSCITPPAHQKQYVEAAMVQARGVEASTPCTRCARGAGPFVSCKHMAPIRRSMVGQVIEKLFLNGACANCYFGRKGAHCSLRKAHEKETNIKVRYNRKKDENGEDRKKLYAKSSGTMVLRSSGSATIGA